jgi:hypothetical protein
MVIFTVNVPQVANEETFKISKTFCKLTQYFDCLLTQTHYQMSLPFHSHSFHFMTCQAHFHWSNIFLTPSYSLLQSTPMPSHIPHSTNDTETNIAFQFLLKSWFM